MKKFIYVGLSLLCLDASWAAEHSGDESCVALSPSTNTGYNESPVDPDDFFNEDFRYENYGYSFFFWGPPAEIQPAPES